MEVGDPMQVSEVTRFGERRLSPDYSSSCKVLFHPLIVEDLLPVLLQQHSSYLLFLRKIRRVLNQIVIFLTCPAQVRSRAHDQNKRAKLIP